MEIYNAALRRAELVPLAAPHAPSSIGIPFLDRRL